MHIKCRYRRYDSWGPIKYTTAGQRARLGPGWGFYAPHILFSAHDHNTWMFVMQEWKRWLATDLLTASWMENVVKVWWRWHQCYSSKLQYQREFRDEKGSKRHHTTAERSVYIEMNLRSDAASVDQRVELQSWEETDPHRSNVLPLLYTFHCYLKDLTSVLFIFVKMI